VRNFFVGLIFKAGVVVIAVGIAILFLINRIPGINLCKEGDKECKY
jgi:hypothetical protein